VDIVLPPITDEEAVKVIYVDHCCGVYRTLQSIFPGVVVKLDPFHWLKHWNVLLVDPSTAAQAGIFLQMMSRRAIFSVKEGEFKDAKVSARNKKKREPTIKEIMLEAKISIPEPSVLRNNVEACYRYFLAKDADIEAHLAAVIDNDTAPKPHESFKGGNKIRDTVHKQLS
jgi:hypothetical protein